MRITILIPTWNSERYIKRALDSIINNGFEDIEIKIMDNCSSDKTLEVVNKFKDPRIKLIQKKDNSMYEALNRGIKESNGEIVGWLGCDDRYVEGIFKKISKIFEQKKVNWVVGEGVFVYENENNRTAEHQLPHDIYEKQILYANPLISPSVFFRKSLFDEVGGFSEKYRYASDYDLWIKFIRKERPYILRSLVSIFSYNGSNISSNKKVSMYKETIDILKKAYKYKPSIWILLNLLRMYMLIVYNLIATPR